MIIDVKQRKRCKKTFNITVCPFNDIDSNY